MLKFLVAIFRFLFLKAKADAPSIEKEIAAILSAANVNVAKLRQEHTQATLRAQMEDDIKAVEQTAQHHIALIKKSFEAELTKVSAALPSVASQLGVAIGAISPTGSTGPSGPTGA